MLIAEFEEPDPFASLEVGDHETQNNEYSHEQSQNPYKDYEEAVGYYSKYLISLIMFIRTVKSLIK